MNLHREVQRPTLTPFFELLSELALAGLLCGSFGFAYIWGMHNVAPHAATSVPKLTPPVFHQALGNATPNYVNEYFYLSESTRLRYLQMRDGDSVWIGDSSTDAHVIHGTNPSP